MAQAPEKGGDWLGAAAVAAHWAAMIPGGSGCVAMDCSRLTAPVMFSGIGLPGLTLYSSIHRAALMLVLGAILAGCATSPPRHPLPPELADQARLPNMPADVRYWSDDGVSALRDWLEPAADSLLACCAAIVNTPHNYLVVSSGGVDGAFGAGLLVGWTAAGTRPEFQIVTGVSTGATIATLAFLGPEYDDSLRQVYSSYSTADFVERRSFTETLTGDAAMDTARFRQLIDHYLGDEEVARIAAEARKGRKLLIGTTHLDAARPVVWDLTRIAASGAPNARDLIGDLILASSTLPGVFPPVRIDVEANGVGYDELHVDGGVTSMLFLGPTGFDWQRVVEYLHVAGKPQVYVIRNARERPYLEALRESISPLLERTASSIARDERGLPEWDQVDPRVSAVLWRSLWSMFLTRGLEDPVRVFSAAQGDALELNLARIPADFEHDSDEFLDRDFMRALFERGYEMAKGGYPWIREPAREVTASEPGAGVGDSSSKPR